MHRRTLHSTHQWRLICLCERVQVPFGALSDSTRAALTAGLESTGVKKEIENEGDDAVYTLLPEVCTSVVGMPECITRTPKTATSAHPPRARAAR